MQEYWSAVENDQISESCYLWQEDVLRQKKYEDIANKYDLRYKIFQSIVFM